MQTGCVDAGYVDGMLVQTVTATSATLTGLAPASAYALSAAAIDAEGNASSAA